MKHRYEAPVMKPKALQYLLLVPIRCYRRFVSPIKPPCCRYHPTCSLYAQQAIERHGMLRGSWLTLKRILRCHPFAGYGEDPVSEQET